MQRPERFLSCDWGTSTFRLRSVQTKGLRFLAEVRTARGVQTVRTEVAQRGVRAETAFEETLCSALKELAQKSNDSLADLPIIISGMATSTIGWLELPYAQLPLALDGSGLPIAEKEVMTAVTGSHRVLLLSGLSTDDDVMRGEEVEILGLLSCAEYKALTDAVLLILPGTHSKHVEIRERQIVDFRTYMTGELFDVLGAHSILRHSVETPAGETPAPSPAAKESFIEGVRAASKTALSGALFKVRTNQVLKQLSVGDNRNYLSGLLIGSELADAQRAAGDYPTLLAASAALLPAYSTACEALGMDVIRVPETLTSSASARGQLCCYH